MATFSTSTVGIPQNLYHHRRVAPTSAKPCFICQRPSASVLITPEQDDFFYACAGHLQDPGFASPVVTGSADDEAGKEKQRRKELLEEEVERLKKEWEEKLKKKGDKDKKMDKKKDKKMDEKKDEKKEKKGEKNEEEAKAEPKIFTLHRKVYEIRVMRARQQQQARRNYELLKNPNLFPTVPKRDPV